MTEHQRTPQLSLFEELKRRKVFRVAVVYAATGFVVLQAADLLATGLALPTWIFAALTVITVLGFPLALVLAWAFELTPEGVQRADAAAATVPASWLGRRTLLASGGLLAVGVLLATGWVTMSQPPRAAAGDVAAGSRTYVVAQIESMNVDVRMARDRFAVSPDGSAIVLVGLDRNGAEGLLLRQAGRLAPVLIPGTTNRSHSPVFSPDGRWIAWYEAATRALMKVPVDGSLPPVSLGVLDGLDRLTWGPDDRIRIAHAANSGSRLIAVDARTAAADTLGFGADTAVVRGDLLPRGRLLLSLVIGDTLERIVTRERNGRLRTLADGGDARWSPSGHILFVRREGQQRVLMAAPLSPRSGTLAGEFITLQRNAPSAGRTPAVLTARGDLVHLAALDRADRRIVLLDRRGFEREIAGAGRPWIEARPSPDGSLLAATVWQYGGRRIWTVSVATGAMHPVTHDGETFGPIWSSDGRHLVYIDIQGQRVNGGSMIRVPTDGSTAGVAIWPEHDAYTHDIASDGGLLLFRSTQRARVEVLPLHPDSAPRALLPTPLGESGASLSPDGRWVAFRTTATGRSEVRLGPMSDPGAAVPVARGEAEPVGWSRDGRYFFRTGDEVWQVRPGAAGAAGEALRAFTLPHDVVRTPYVMPDGEHLVLIRGSRMVTDVVVVEGALRPGRRP
jgi:Tol biopolymer transport system component